MNISAYIGYDKRWPLAYAVAVRSMIFQSAGCRISIDPLMLQDLQAKGIYNRTTSIIDNQMFDEISEAPMATEFAISRFFIPFLEEYKGWSLFTDSDFLFRAPLAELFAKIDPSKAVMCVKHDYAPPEITKMDGQMQTLYKRKNWSSLMLINNEHPKNQILEPTLLNALTGRDLHAFSWLDDDDIGELGPEWNWLEGHSDPSIHPKIVHYTRGTPDMMEPQILPYSDEWWAVAAGINLCKEL